MTSMPFQQVFIHHHLINGTEVMISESQGVLLEFPVFWTDQQS
jgi:hypothetical protein